MSDSPTPALEVDPTILASDDSSTDDSKSIASSTTSVAESIFNYRRLHGRPYSSSHTTEYWTPVDDIQNEAFDFFHNAHVMISDDQLFSAPINDDPANVLDVGTGTGIWAIDFAYQFPRAEVTGTDMNATQPSWVPKNCSFIVDDVLLDWSFPVNHFDFIHVRGLYGSVPDWSKLYSKVLDHVKPGGWFEHVETECRLETDHAKLPADHVFNQWADLFYAGGDKMGRTFAIARGHDMKELMENAGFVDVVEKKIKMPMHGWARDKKMRDVGLMSQLALDQAIEGLAVFLLTQVHGWDHDEAMVFTNKFRQESRRAANCAWIWRYVSTCYVG